MGTALAEVKASNYLALQPGSELAEAIKLNLDGGALKESDLTRVPTPSQGNTTWVIPSITGDEETKEIVGVLAFICSRGLLWAREGDAKEGERPVLTTYDMSTAYLTGDIPGEIAHVLKQHQIGERTYNWKTLPYNEFGTAAKGTGKRVKEQRVMFILRENDALPIVVAAGPSSLKNIDKLRLDLAKKAIVFYRAVVKLTLTPDKNSDGTKFSKIVPSLHGVLSSQDGAVVRDTWTTVLQSMAAPIKDLPNPGEPGYEKPNTEANQESQSSEPSADEPPPF